jgi:hypothetical protein
MWAIQLDRADLQLAKIARQRNMKAVNFRYMTGNERALEAFGSRSGNVIQMD